MGGTPGRHDDSRVPCSPACSNPARGGPPWPRGAQPQSARPPARRTRGTPPSNRIWRNRPERVTWTWARRPRPMRSEEIPARCGRAYSWRWRAVSRWPSSASGRTPMTGPAGRRPRRRRSRPVSARPSGRSSSRYCLGCHGTDKPKGDLDLSVFTTAESVAKDLPRWELVLEQLEAGVDAPGEGEAAARRPRPATRSIAWIGAVRKLEATRNAGDPGPVPARRLSNAEYDNTIRDLTGVDIRPTREFPVDPANEAGFDNSAESLAMSPALVEEVPGGGAAGRRPPRPQAGRARLRAAPDARRHRPRQVLRPADHRLLQAAEDRLRRLLPRRLAVPAPRRPSASPMPRSTTSPTSRGSAASTWRRSGRRSTGPPEEVGPIAALQAMWRRAARTPRRVEPDAARAGCERMRDFVVELRQPARPRGQEPDRAGDQQRDAALRALEEPPVRRQPDAIRGRRGEDPGRRAAAWRARPPGPWPSPTTRRNPQRFEATFDRFCRTFPDAFFVSERARVYLDPKEEKGNAGRLLSAGFHSMTGYFRDDGPLSELMLDEAGRRELDRLWREFDFITGAPMRQYSSYLWYERAETGFLRGDEAFDFVRAEDKDAASEAKMGRFAEVYLAKAAAARGERPGDPAPSRISSGSSPRRSAASSGTGREAEPRHVEALQQFAERAYRRPLSTEERRGVAASTGTSARRTGWATRTPSATRSSASSCRPTSATGSTCPARRVGRPAAVGLRPGQPPELLPLGEHARRRAARPRRRGRPAPARGAGGPGPADAPRRPRARAWPRSSAATGSTSAGSRSTTASIAAGSPRSTTSCGGRCSRSRSGSSSTWSANDRPVTRVPRRQAHVRQPGARPALRHARARRRARRLGPGRRRDPIRPRRACCRWRCS